MKIITAVSRIVVGLLFIFSGFIKANDPIGFSYKLVEYYGIFGTTFLNSSAVIQAVIICVLEIVLGVAVLIGIRMKITAWLLLLLIVFFTFLTGYTAIANWFHENPEHGTTRFFAELFSFDPATIYYMTDCGCFGDAIKLTPWESFFKDLVLLILIIIIFVRRNKILPFFARIMQTNILVFFTLASTAYSVYCVYYLPAMNFLKWDDQIDIKPLTKGIEPKIEFFFVYDHNGVRDTFAQQELPDDVSSEAYKYVSWFEKVVDPGKPAAIHDFRLSGPGDTSGYEHEILDKDNYKLLVISHNLDKSRKRAWKKLAETIVAWESKGYDVYGITGTSPAEAEKFRHEHQLPLQFYFLDPTAAKAMIRSNPGIILMKKSTIIGRYPATGVPSIEKLEKRIRRYEKKQAKH